MYYAHVAKLTSARMLLFRPDRHKRAVMLKDASTTFLQSYRYDTETVKYISFKDPVTGELEYFRQQAPIYGEASAPKRWEDTFTDWLVQQQGFERGENDQCVFNHRLKDIVNLLFVDDNLADGEQEDLERFAAEMEKEFECKQNEMLTSESDLDYLGMTISIDHEKIYISMQSYIESVIQDIADKLNVSTRHVDTPIDSPIETSDRLSTNEHRMFMTAVGAVGRLANTARPDVAYAYSRVSQHMATPNASALSCTKRILQYLLSSKELTIAADLHQPDVDPPINAQDMTKAVNEAWRFYTDSDHAGNSEEQNKRKSQYGFLATECKGQLAWYSKVSSIAFADEDIQENHADVSSGVAEVYGAGNAANELLYLSYAADEMGLIMPKPMVLEMDNTTAESFTKNSCWKSKLKHIDCRQQWVKVLREKNIICPKHVDTKANLADLFTQILPPKTFLCLRDQVMTCKSSA